MILLLMLALQGASPETDAVMARSRREAAAARQATREAAAPQAVLPLAPETAAKLQACLDSATAEPPTTGGWRAAASMRGNAWASPMPRQTGGRPRPSRSSRPPRKPSVQVTFPAVHDYGRRPAMRRWPAVRRRRRATISMRRWRAAWRTASPRGKPISIAPARASRSMIFPARGRISTARSISRRAIRWHGCCPPRSPGAAAK